jgi:hypothetical protein
MNRCIYLNRGDLSRDDLTQTAAALLGESKNDTLNEQIPAITDAYLDILKRQIAVRPIEKDYSAALCDFFGARDFYKLIEFLDREMTASMSSSLTPELILKGFWRNFGGLPDAAASDCVLYSVRNRFPSMGVRGAFADPLELIRENLEDQHSRHLMVLTNQDWDLLWDYGVLTHDNCRVIFGANFPKDKGSLSLTSSHLNQIKECMEVGHKVLLIGHEDLHDRFLTFGLWLVACGLWIVDCGLWIVDCGLWIVDCGLFSPFVCSFSLQFKKHSLYELLNQHYTNFGERKFCRISKGAQSRTCPVDEKFKCIIPAEPELAYRGLELPPPFLNRFEKQHVDRSLLLSEDKILMQVLRNLEQLCRQIAAGFGAGATVTAGMGNGEREMERKMAMGGGLRQPSIEGCFVGYHSQYLASLVTAIGSKFSGESIKTIEQQCQLVLLANTFPETMLKSNMERDQKAKINELYQRAVRESLQQILGEIQAPQFMTENKNGGAQIFACTYAVPRIDLKEQLGTSSVLVSYFFCLVLAWVLFLVVEVDVVFSFFSSFLLFFFSSFLLFFFSSFLLFFFSSFLLFFFSCWFTCKK